MQSGGLYCVPKRADVEINECATSHDEAHLAAVHIYKQMTKEEVEWMNR